MGKLSKTMETLISEAIYMRGRHTAKEHQGRYSVAGNAGTLKALVKRELAEVVGTWHVLTDAGIVEWRRIRTEHGEAMDALHGPNPLDVAYEARLKRDAEEAAHWADVAAADELIAQGAEIDQRAQTWERAGDAERIAQVEEDFAEGAQVEAEQRAEVEFETMLARLGMDMDDYAELAAELAQERAACWDCDPEDMNGTVGACRQHASVEAYLDHLTLTEESGIPIKVECEGASFILTMSADAGIVVVTGSVLVDNHGELFTVTGARLSRGGTRVLIGRYATGGVGAAPYRRFPWLMWRAAPSGPWRPIREGENAPVVYADSRPAPVARVTTATPWKTSNGKRSKSSKRGWRK